MPAERYTAIRVRVEAADDFRRLIRRVAAEADQDLTQSDVLSAVTAYALDHVSEVAARLGQSPESEDENE